ncbi:DUF3951 domain-containing protein [Paenibacillus sp. GCM10027627]|uniref:DUF3951 domain-containing protein n=1 Tax=unclassified Paenibacillus TaxID=185978 RepID=UPI0036412D98
MNASLLLLLGVPSALFLILAIVIGKMIVTKEAPSNAYTPFDHITGHSQVEFHDEKQEKEQEDDQGDDKNKNRARL